MSVANYYDHNVILNILQCIYEYMDLYKYL